MENIEKFGCEVMHVTSSTGPDWSYTIGVYETCGQPDVITVGLKRETAHFLLNEAARRLRNGDDLSTDRQRDFFNNVECEFRPVAPKWSKQSMGWAHWFYEGKEFPVLQAIYPDLENRFPGDSGFDLRFRQPLLQPDAVITEVEQEFWSSSNPKNQPSNWNFSDPPNTMVFLSEAVHTKAEPITYVSHDADDGAWQFLGDSMSGDKPPVLCCFHHPVEQDRTLKELADLPLGWWAERAKPGDPWIRHQHDPNEIAEDD